MMIPGSKREADLVVLQKLALGSFELKVIDWRSGKAKGVRRVKSILPFESLFVTENYFILAFSIEELHIGRTTSSFCNKIETKSKVFLVTECFNFRSSASLALLLETGKVIYYDQCMKRLCEEMAQLPPNVRQSSRFVAIDSTLWFLIDHQLWTVQSQSTLAPKLHNSRIGFFTDIRVTGTGLIRLILSKDMDELVLLGGPLENEQPLITYKLFPGFQFHSAWITRIIGAHQGQTHGFFIRDTGNSLVAVMGQSPCQGFLVTSTQFAEDKIKVKVEGKKTFLLQWNEQKREVDSCEVSKEQNEEELKRQIDNPSTRIEMLREEFSLKILQKCGLETFKMLILAKKEEGNPEELNTTYELKNLERLVQLIKCEAEAIESEISPRNLLPVDSVCRTTEYFQGAITHLKKLQTLLAVCMERKETEAKENALLAHRELGLPCKEFMEQDVFHLNNFKDVGKLLSNLLFLAGISAFFSCQEFKADYQAHLEAIAISWQKRKSKLKKELFFGNEAEKTSFCEFLFPIVYPVPTAQLPGLFSTVDSRFFQLLRLVYICMDLSEVSRCPSQKYFALLQSKVFLTESSLSVGIGIWLCDCLFEPVLNPMKTSLKKLVHLVSSKTLPVEWERQFARLLCGKDSPRSLFLYSRTSSPEWNRRENIEFYLSVSVQKGLIGEALTFLKFLASAKNDKSGVPLKEKQFYLGLFQKLVSMVVSSKKTRDFFSLALSEEEKKLLLGVLREKNAQKELYLFSLYFSEVRAVMEDYRQRVVQPGKELIPQVEEIGKLIVEKGSLMETPSQTKKELAWMFPSAESIELSN